ncbi:MAG: right-handed parallel beta-helix repeat-containing protein [Nitrospira sp.]|nr:right-handed parallel beta-helix repeat-containing protein [Nitrospira sp.]
MFTCQAWAATRYVDATAGVCTGNYSIASRNCTGSDGNSYSTIAAGLTATAAGDTLYVRAGTFPVQITGTIPSGVSSSAKTTFAAYTGETVTLNPTNAATSTRVILITGQDNIVISGFVINGAGVTSDGIKLDSFSENIEIIGNEIKNAPGQCIYVGRVGGNVIRNNNMHDCGVDGFEHGIYYSAATNGTIEGNLIHDNAGSGIQMYSESTGTRFRHNKVYNNCRGASVTTGSQVIVSYQNNIVEFNDIYETGGNCTNGVLVNNANPLNTTIRHNSIYCTGNCTYATGAGVKISQGTGAVVANNIILGYSNATIDSATGTTFTTNRTTGTATAIWLSPSGGNLHLNAGSAAIDAGTNIGLPFNGSAPDQGAYETFSCSGGTITGNAADVQCDMALNTPMSEGDSGGWSVNNGRTVTGVEIVGSSVVRLTFSGAACAGESWTYGYEDGLGTASDSRGQLLYDIGATALTNNCSGTTYVLTQETGAFYGALGSQATASTLADVAPGGIFAVRTKTSVTVAVPPSGITTKLQYSTTGSSGTYADVPNTFGADNIRYYGTGLRSGMDTHGTPVTTERLTSQFGTNISSGVRRCGAGCEAPAMAFTQDSEGETVWILELDLDTAVGTTYHFREVLTDGSTLSYAVNSKPGITVVAPAGVF